MTDMSITKRFFGKTKDGKDVEAYILNDNGITVEILTFGGIIRNIILETPDGPRDINLGFDTIAGYEASSAYIGALIGRYANRIENAEFKLNSKKYKLDVNDGNASIHGGFNAIDKKVWDATVEPDGLLLKLFSPDMENGYPGNLNIEVKYSLKNNELTIDYSATCDADTPLNLTNHAYFNLNGHATGGIEDHLMQIFADKVTMINKSFALTGQLLDVTGTPLDFRKPIQIGKGINSNFEQIVNGGGYDHNYILSDLPYHTITTAAVVESGGVRMTCSTTMPGVQLYTGNMLNGETGKDGAKYEKRSGLCLETQFWPDSVNKPGFPDSILKKGKVYHHTTVYKFDC